MKRSILALLLALLCAPALARAERVTVAHLREQAETMGRWTKTYEAHGRTIDVDIPVIVPDVDAFPVVTVERAVPLTDEQMTRLLDEGKRVDADLVFDIGEGGAPGNLWIVGEWGRMDDPRSRAGVSVNRGALAFTGAQAECRFAWDMDADTAYAGSTTLDDAAACLKRTLAACYPDAAIDVAFDKVRLNGPYNVEARQLVQGIPVLGSVSSLDLHHTATPETERAEKACADKATALWNARSSISMSYTDDANYFLNAWAVREREVVMADVPLAPLEAVIAGIEAEIEAGRVRAVYALALGYVLYADAGSEAFVWAAPSWLLECTYAHSAEEKLLREQDARYVDEGTPVWDEWEYEQIAINAQTGEWVKYTVPQADTYLCPEIEGW